MADPIDFTPVPRKFNRRDGWTAERQRGFIKALSEIGDVDKAAQTQGLTGNGAYQLRKALGAESFAAAWDRALDRKKGRVRSGRRAAEATAAGSEDDEAALRRRKAALRRLLSLYAIKLNQERDARLAGDIPAADFYCRQLMFLEVSFCLGGHGFKLLEAMRGGPAAFGSLRVCATPMFMLLDRVRREHWRGRGEPERPANSMIAYIDEMIGYDSTGSAERPVGDATWADAKRQQGERAAIAAEAQRLWEEQAKADAREWRAREDAARAKAGLPSLESLGLPPID